MKMFLVSGVPMSMQQDGWWMASDAPGTPVPPSAKSTGKPDESSVRLAVLAALVALADLLVWQVSPGISLVVFFIALLGAALTLLRQPSPSVRIRLALLTAGVALLPLIEQVQALSVLVAMLGISIAAVVGTVGVSGLGTGVLRLWQALPLTGLNDAITSTRGLAQEVGVRTFVTRIAVHWALPLGFGLAFVGLLAEANPMMAQWLQDVSRIALHGPGAGRIMFWLGLALLIWPLLVLGRMQQWLRLPFAQRPLPQIAALPLINAGAVARSLILFNGLFLIQSGMDVAYLWGGAALPEGMSYAHYAHRGAYPLVATALLAGLFALLSRPFADANKALRIALLLFVAQNVFLVCSSLFRLDLYVDAYGLTRLRLAAFIWMALVGTGLCLIVWQTVRRHGNGWLMRRLTLLGAATIYACTLISFDAAIARHNLTHDVPQDREYLCNLGPAALPAIKAHTRKTGTNVCRYLGQPNPPEFADWREWGFRDWRVLRSLSGMKTPAIAP